MPPGYFHGFPERPREANTDNRHGGTVSPKSARRPAGTWGRLFRAENQDYWYKENVSMLFGKAIFDVWGKGNT